MQIIGHRGARGLETENTIESMQKALEVGADGVELDVWTTRDGVPVVSHDSDLVRMTGHNGQIFDLHYSQIKKIKTRNGKSIPTAEEALEHLNGLVIFLEVKDFFLNDSLLTLIDNFAGPKLNITSFQHRILSELKNKRPSLKLYAASHTNPFRVIRLATNNDFEGVTLNWKTFTLAAYWYARHKNLKIVLFTVNSTLYMKLVKKFNLKLDIITDYPDRAMKIFKN